MTDKPDPGDIRNCKVLVDCPKKWSDLEHLTDVTRHCNKCDETVFLCRTDAELAEAIKLNHCVAIHLDSGSGQEWSNEFVGRLAPPKYEVD